jgi:sec-independent protein translocase protein TatC
MPIVMFALSAMGLVSFELLSKTRVYAFTVILILVALIAPSPDPITFMAMGLPVLAIYELCIWIVWLMERRRRTRAV